ncbi:MAG: sodium-dependent transporter [Gammaproteobacteria bacterium]|nr:sodium-dependent transporter [Gammaproteobacteria bacterium]
MNKGLALLVSSADAISTNGSTWSSRWMFILAATGAAIGLGNIWKFPYIAGEYGGGAFVLVYLGFVFLFGLPLLTAELLIGRQGGAVPENALRTIAQAAGKSEFWQYAGTMGAFTAGLLLSLYSVVAGWSLAYTGFAASGTLLNAEIPAVFSGLLADPLTQFGCHTLFMAVTTWVVANGIQDGIERSVRYLMPLLFIMLVALAVSSALLTGEFSSSVNFLFRPNFSALSLAAFSEAAGHAFYTLSLGVCGMMVYGAFLDRKVSITRAALTVATIDTLVAITAALMIFPIVFAKGLAASAGPGLIFITLPMAFAELPQGRWIATAFFILIAIAAWTSAVAILTVVAKSISGRFKVALMPAAVLSGFAIWLLGIASVLANNHWAHIKIAGLGIIDFLDTLLTGILLPSGGLAVALFAGWVMNMRQIQSELRELNSLQCRTWRMLIRYIAPLGLVTMIICRFV